MDRIKNLRDYALNNTVCTDEFFYKFYMHYINNENASKELRYSDAFYYAFSNLTPSISDDELTELMVLQEELKTATFVDIWEEYLNREHVSANYIDEVLKYEKEILPKR